MGINFENIRLDTNFLIDVQTTKEITTIPERRPKKLEFFRVRDGEDWTFDAYLLDLNEEDEKYLVDPKYYPELLQLGLLKAVRFYYLIAYGTGIVFISDVTLPDAEGKHHQFNKTRMEHYERGKKEWIKIVSDKPLQAYKIILPTAKFPEPEWPSKPANILEALKISFKDKYIESDDHPVLRKIRGEV